MVFRAFCVKSVLTLGSTKRKRCFSFVLLSLIRTLDLKVQGTSARK